MYTIGRGLQVIGLLITPAGILAQLEGSITLKASLVIAGAGIAIFMLGQFFQKTSGQGG